MTASSGRRPDIDALRVLAIAVVFLVHCAQVFSPLQYWRIQNEQRSVLLGQFTLIAWPWVMPLFMLLAGSGACYALSRRSDRAYLRERSIRLALPVVVGTFLLMPPQIWVERLAQGRFEGSLWAFLPRFVEGTYPEGNLSAGHLWFLAYLYVYAVLFLPALRWLGTARGSAWLNGLERTLSARWRLLFLPALPIAVGQIALRARYPETLNLVNDWSNHALLVTVYFYGYLLVARPTLRSRVHDVWAGASAIAVLGSVWLSLEIWTSTEPGFLPGSYGWSYGTFWAVFALTTWCWIAALLGAAQRWVRSHSSTLAWASEGVFLFYVLHQTVIVLVAYRVVRWEAPVVVEFATIALTSLGITLLSVEAARRWSLTRKVFGLDRG